MIDSALGLGKKGADQTFVKWLIEHDLLTRTEYPKTGDIVASWRDGNLNYIGNLTKNGTVTLGGSEYRLEDQTSGDTILFYYRLELGEADRLYERFIRK